MAENSVWLISEASASRIVKKFVFEKIVPDVNTERMIPVVILNLRSFAGRAVKTNGKDYGRRKRHRGSETLGIIP